VGHESTVYYVVGAVGDRKANVSWIIDGKTPLFMRAIMLFMDMDKMLGAMFEKGLSNLKAVTENRPAEPQAVHYDVQETTWEAKTFYGRQVKLSTDKLATFFCSRLAGYSRRIGERKRTQPVVCSGGVCNRPDDRKRPIQIVNEDPLPGKLIGSNVSLNPL
jgi:hypothetical protein